MLLSLLLPYSIFILFESTNSTEKIQGAWQSGSGIMIVSGDYFTYCEFSTDAFDYTYGGSYSTKGDQFIATYEFHSGDSAKVKTDESMTMKLKGEKLTIGKKEYTRVDDGTLGKLAGTWLFTNRERDGSMGTPRLPDNPRKTMKILSGTRFQWIAYNVETRQFMGTGGGTYTTIDGKYTESIDFFSRDQSRVGAELEFEFELKNNEWRHRGKSSKGDPMYEIWTLRD